MRRRRRKRKQHKRLKRFLGVSLIALAVVLAYLPATPVKAEDSTTLISGNEFREKIFSLGITSGAYCKFEWNEEAKNEGIEIQKEDETIPVYLKLSEDSTETEAIIYVYSDSDVIYANEDSSRMFSSYNYITDENYTEIRYTDVNALVTRLNTERVKNMSGMFRNCENLETLDLSRFESGAGSDRTLNEVNCNSMFLGCKKLASVSLCNTNSQWGLWIRVCNYMFKDCESLKELDLRDCHFDCEDCREMFSGCKSLEKIEHSEHFGSNIKTYTLQAMFKNCESLKEIDLGLFEVGNVVWFDEMFYGCKSITKLNLGGFYIRKEV